MAAPPLPTLRPLAHASLRALAATWIGGCEDAIGEVSRGLAGMADELPDALVAALEPAARAEAVGAVVEPPGAVGRRLAAVAHSVGESHAVRLHFGLVSAARAEAERLAPLAAALDLALDALGSPPAPPLVDALQQAEDALRSAGPATAEAPAPLSLGPGRMAGVLGLPLVEAALCAAPAVSAEQVALLVAEALPPRATRDAGISAWSRFALTRLLLPLEAALRDAAPAATQAPTSAASTPPAAPTPAASTSSEAP